MAGGAAAPAPRVLPWAFCLKFGAAGAIYVVPAALFSGVPGAATAAAAGLSVGLLGSILARPRTALMAGLALLAGLSLATLWPGPVIAWAVALMLAAGAGLEAAGPGGRAAVMALFAWCVLILVPAAPDPAEAWPLTAGAVAWGLVCARVLRLDGVAAPPPAAPEFGVGLTLFLMLGLGLAVLLMQRMDHAFAYWVVLLFVFRAVAPAGQTQASALKFATGAVLGSLLGLVAALLALPVAVAAPLAAGLALLGLRYLPHPRPLSAIAFTSAVLVGLAPGAANAVFRVEAAVLAVALTCALCALLGWVWRLLTTAGGDQA